MSYLDESGLSLATTKLKSYIDTQIASAGGDNLTAQLINGTISQYIDTAGEVNIVKHYKFYSCSNLTKVSIPNCYNIGLSAFAECGKLSEINMESVTYINAQAFQNCYSLTSINLPICSVIDGSAFQGCNNLSIINIPNLINIQASTFQNCYSVQVLDFPKVQNVYLQAFAGCSNVNQISLPICLTYSADLNNHKCSQVNLPMCRDFGYTMQKCSLLTDISLPVVNGFGNSNVFQSCSSLQTAMLGFNAGLVSTMFSNCNALESVYICNCSTALSLNNINAFYNTPISKSSYLGYYGSIYVPSQVVDTLKTATNWSTYADRITALPASINQEFVCAWEFTNSTLTSIPAEKSNCRYIGRNAFQNCYSLESANCLSCTYIDQYAFQNNSALTEVNMPSCKYIGVSAFQSCYNLSSIDLSGCLYLGQYAFDHCSALTEVNMPDCLTIGASAFHYCSNLSSVNFENCTAVTGSYVFYQTKLETANFPNLLSVYYNVFYGTKIRELDLPKCSNVQGQGGFNFCTQLGRLSLPVCSFIGLQALSQCNALSQLIIGTQYSSVCSCTGSLMYTPMNSTSYLGYYGSIYVPDNLVDNYRVATGWTSLSQRITGISNLPSV